MNSWITLVSRTVQNSHCVALFLDAFLKSFIVLALAGGVCVLWRRSSSATRHLIWFLAVASLPCLPLLSSMLPSWQRPLWSVSTGYDSGNRVSLALELAPGTSPGTLAPETPAAPGRAESPNVSHDPSGGSRQIAAHFSANWLVFGGIAWFAGTALVLISTASGQLRLRKFSRKAQPLQGADWTVLLEEVRETLRLRRAVNLLQSADNVMPLTWGWWRPAVLLPTESGQWPVERRRIVLLHELAHVKRWDCLTQFTAKIFCAFYWFNPLAWLAARRMCVERERACDDLVLYAGCKASDYAGHLVEIAKNFRRVPQVAAIAMARSSQLEGRITAIVDASRNRRLRLATAMAILAVVGGITLGLGGNRPGTAGSGTDESNLLRKQQIARLEAFSMEKEKQSQTLAAAAGEKISPEFQRFFVAATKGDWQTVTNMYESFKKRHPQYSNKHQHPELSLRTRFWQPVLEISMAYDHVVNCEPKYTQIAVDGIINSIPAGSIYFGGTDPGRALPTAFCKSHVDADPFYTLTQNALADWSYLEYLKNTYGEQAKLLNQVIEARRADRQLQAWDAEWPAVVQKLDSVETDKADPQYKAAEEAVNDLSRKRDERMKIILAEVQARADAEKTVGKNQAETKSIYTPTGEDSQKCFQDYMQDAVQRLHNHQLKPNEDFREEPDGRIMVSGQVAVMSINGLLVKIIFDRNPGREFYIEESFPLDWMYPYLEPHGLIMKINRQPLPELSDEIVQRDHDCWTRCIRPMIGDWLNYDTPVQQVVAFVEKVQLKQDLSGFKGDLRFVQNDYARKMFSKLRSSLGGIYAWRMNHSTSASEKERMAREADFAFRQALALCPYSPEVINRYVDLLKSQNRISDAILVAETAAKFPLSEGIDPASFRTLAGELKQAAGAK
jgi:beta-lactamase regulating signal transducer with metallopeptidase domain